MPLTSLQSIYLSAETEIEYDLPVYQREAYKEPLPPYEQIKPPKPKKFKKTRAWLTKLKVRYMTWKSLEYGVKVVLIALLIMTVLFLLVHGRSENKPSAEERQN